MRIGFIIDTLTSVDKQEFVKFVSKVLKINEGVIHTEIFKSSALGKVLEILFNLRLKYKEEGNDIL